MSADQKHEQPLNRWLADQRDCLARLQELTPLRDQFRASALETPQARPDKTRKPDRKFVTYYGRNKHRIVKRGRNS
jgi:hypothetical protein